MAISDKLALGSAAVALTLLAAAAVGGMQTRPSAGEPPSNTQPQPSEGLPIAHISQETMLCVPTSAAMILAYYGQSVAPRQIKALASGRSYDPSQPFNDFTITYYRDLVRAVKTLGYDWSEKDFANNDAGFAEGLNLIQSELTAGRPVMADVSEPQGHTFVIHGFDPKTQTLWIIDPGLPAPGQTSLSVQAFHDIWNERAWHGNFRAMVTTQAKTSSPG